MSVFICCADESTDGRQQTDFFFGGYAATVDTWENDFTPAWIERVLQGRPSLDYLHMSDIVRRRWRIDHGVTQIEAERRKDEASRVLGSSGGLIPFVCHLSQSTFKNDILPYAPMNRHSALEEPDYLVFLAYSYTTLHWLKTFRPEVEKVDYWIEKNGKISTRIGRLHERVAGNLRELGREDLAALVGECLPVPKDRVQAQAADFICWHERNAKNGTLDRSGWRRRTRLTHEREGFRTDVDSTLLKEFCRSLKETFLPVRKSASIAPALPAGVGRGNRRAAAGRSITSTVR
jgi:hypothetical protein